MAACSQASFAFHTCSNQKACANFHKKSRSGMTPLGFRKRLPVSQFRRCHTMDEPREGCVLGQRKNAGDTAGERRKCWARFARNLRPVQGRRSGRRAFQWEPAMPSATFSGEPAMFCTVGMMPGALRYKQPATPEAQKSIAGALRAPDLDATDAFAGFIGVLGLPSKTSSVSLAKRHVFDIYLIHSGTHL
jgi:hypothetical protein